MARKYLDCREFKSEVPCTVAISADTDEELLEAAVQHGESVHGYKDSPEFREELKKGFREGVPAA